MTKGKGKLSVDFALWGFILGAIGAILSSILTVQQIVGGLRAKSEEREKTVKVLFQEILGPIHSMHHEFDNDMAHYVVNNLGKRRDRILGLGPTITKVAPDISRDLAYLMGLVGRNEMPLESAYAIVNDSKCKVLIPRLHSNIEKWLSDQA